MVCSRARHRKRWKQKSGLNVAISTFTFDLFEFLINSHHRGGVSYAVWGISAHTKKV